MFNKTFDQQFTPLSVHQLLAVHGICSGKQTKSKYTFALGES